MDDGHLLAHRAGFLKAICVFGGGIRRAEDPGHLGGLGWRSLVSAELDKSASMPSYERVLAASVLYRMNPTIKIVLSGGNTPEEALDGRPQVAAVMAAEIKQLGVPDSALVEDVEGIDTWWQIFHSARIARSLGCSPTQVGIVSLFWHFGRISSMLLQASSRTDLYPFVLGKTPFLSTERVLMSEDSGKWGPYFNELYEHPDVVRSMVSEAMGTGQLLTGHQPKYPHPFRGFSDPLA